MPSKTRLVKAVQRFFFLYSSTSSEYEGFSAQRGQIKSGLTPLDVGGKSRTGLELQPALQQVGQMVIRSNQLQLA